MKKIYFTIIVLFSLIIVQQSFAQGPGPQFCDASYCPEGWLSTRTPSTISIQINDTTYCDAIVCYCFNTDPDDEDPLFQIGRIIWADSSCLQGESFDTELIKLSIVAEIIKIHEIEIPYAECPNSYVTAEVYTSSCYAVYRYTYQDPITYETEQWIVWAPCEDGLCAQMYKYCWDNNYLPPKLFVGAIGSPISFGYPECELPASMPSGWELIDECFTICE